MKKTYLIAFCMLLCQWVQAQSANIEQLAKNIADGLQTTKAKGKQVRLDYFTLDDTHMGSAFAKKLYAALLIELPRKSIAVRNNPNDLDQQKTLASKDQLVVCGAYTEQNGQLVVNAALYDISQKKNITTTKVRIASTILASTNTSWKPQQFEQAKRTRNLIVEDEVQPAPTPESTPKPNPAEYTPEPTPDPDPSTGDFGLEVMTSKGFGHQIFTEGERMQIAVKSEQPCFLRLVYHAADGQKVLLLENEPMKTSDEGNYITVPQEFECAAPFGVETLQLFACTEMFPPLRTHQSDGFIFIDEEIAAVNTKTRGFKPVSGNGKKMLRAEVQVQVTTLGK